MFGDGIKDRSTASPPPSPNPASQPAFCCCCTSTDPPPLPLRHRQRRHAAPFASSVAQPPEGPRVQPAAAPAPLASAALPPPSHGAFRVRPQPGALVPSSAARATAVAAAQPRRETQSCFHSAHAWRPQQSASRARAPPWLVLDAPAQQAESWRPPAPHPPRPCAQPWRRAGAHRSPCRRQTAAPAPLKRSACPDALAAAACKHTCHWPPGSRGAGTTCTGMRAYVQEGNARAAERFAARVNLRSRVPSSSCR